MCSRLSPWWLSLCIAFLPPPLGAQREGSSSAWENLARARPGIAEEASTLEVEILRLMTLEQLHAYLQGAAPAGIALATGESLAEFLTHKGIGELGISWYSLDGGGGEISGGGFTLGGTIGQPDAGTMSGGGFLLTGGFWAGLSSAESGGGSSEQIFSDGFESGNTAGWDHTIGG